MIKQLDEAIRKMLHAEVPSIGNSEVNVSFDTPDSNWTPEGFTLNVFLWDVRRSPLEARSGRIRETAVDGEVTHKLAPPRIACRYLLTAWAKNSIDTHEILGDVLAALLPIQKISDHYMDDFMTEELLMSRPAPDLRVAYPNASDFVDFWSSLGGSVRPGIDLVATMSIDSPVSSLKGGPPIGTSRGVSSDHSPIPWPEKHPGTSSFSELRGGRVIDPDAVGAIVQSPRDESLVAADGKFWIAAEPGDEIKVLTDPPKTAEVPPEGAPIDVQ